MTQLRSAWESAAAGEPQLALVWGRRRTGKTFLLSHFVEGRRAVFFGATQQAQQIELSRLLEATTRDLGPELADLAPGGFPSWEGALRFLAALARDEPLVVVLDEVPYLAGSTPGFASIVQVVWDHLAPGTKLMLVLTGSAVGVIESMLGGGGALRGRPTLTIRLDPVDLIAARVFLPDLAAADYLAAYAACGGYPLHLRAWDQRTTIDENLGRLAATPGGVLLEDAAGILHEELPDAPGYPRVLAAIGRGRTRSSDIAAEAGQRIETPLEVLIRVGFVRRGLPLGAPRRGRPLFDIPDPYLAFWFTVLYSDLQQVAAGPGPQGPARPRPQWGGGLGWMFEEAARAHAARLVARGELPGDMIVGRWWATSGEPCEIDVLGMRGSRTHLVGEARWQARPLGRRALTEVMARAGRAPEPADEI